MAKHRAPLMVMLDECHLYWKKVLELRDSGMTTLGFSATPGKAVLPLFTFSREDSRRAGTTVSLIIDRLSISMNNDRNLKKHEQIAKLTGQHLHPLGKPLASYKGIIYTSSIEEANELADAINQRQSSQGNGPKLARAIHSQVKDYETWIDDFKRKSMDTAAILVVVDMLGTGYDDVDVAWGIYAKNRGSRIENHSQMVGRSLRKNPRFPNKIAYFLTDDELLLDTDEIYKDEEALARAHDDYYEYNHQVIYIELLNAIDKQRPFKHYSPMFAHHKLDFKYSLSKNLMLLLKALASDQEEWSRGLLDLNQDLRRYWKDSRGREFNLAEVFLNEVIGLKEGNKDLLKQSLFTPESFEKLVAILDKQYPDLLSQLTAKISLRELLSKVDLDYTKILRKYNSLPSRVVAGSLIISEGESVIRIRVNSSSSSSSGLNPHAFLNSQGRHVVNDIKQGEQLSPQKEKDSGFPRPMGMD